MQVHTVHLLLLSVVFTYFNFVLALAQGSLPPGNLTALSLKQPSLTFQSKF